MAYISSSKPKVSVICSWFNRYESIEDTLAGLLAQSIDDYEIIIVNDGSTDERVAAQLDRYACKKLKVIHQENSGFTRAIKVAASVSKGEFLTVEGAGDLSHPRRLEIQASLLQENTEVVLLGCIFEQKSPRSEHSTYWEERALGSGTPPVHHYSKQQIMIRNPLGHGGTMFRKSCYMTVGGYRPAFHFAQDYDLWLRMSEKGIVGRLELPLYRQFLFENSGVALNPKKRVEQGMYADLARQAADQRAKFGTDIVEEIGDRAIGLRFATKRSASIEMKISGRYLFAGDFNRARFWAWLAKKEQNGLRQVLVLATTILVSKAPWLMSFVPRRFAPTLAVKTEKSNDDAHI